MPGEFKMEIELERTRYVLNREAAELLLKAVDAFGEDCGDACKRMRADLRKALQATSPDGREAEVVEETTVELVVRPEQPDTARCAWCGESGDELPMRPGDAEPLFVCRTTGCHRNGMPSARNYFTTGYR